MEPSDALQQFHLPRSDDELTLSQTSGTPGEQLEDKTWLQWSQQLKQSDPGRMDKHELTKMSDRIDHTAERMSSFVERCLKALIFRR